MRYALIRKHQSKHPETRLDICSRPRLCELFR
jgi:hypothetical protein